MVGVGLIWGFGALVRSFHRNKFPSSRHSDFGGSHILRWDAGERQHCAPRQGQKEMTFGARI